MFTVKEAAEKLRVSIGTIYALCATTQLRHVRIGTGRGTIRISEAAIEDFLAAASVQPEITTPAEDEWP